MSWSRRRCLALVRADAVASMNSSMQKPWRRAYLEDCEALAAGVLLGGGHAQVGDGFHVLSMEPWFLH